MNSRGRIIANSTQHGNAWSRENEIETAMETLESQRCRNVEHLQRIALSSVQNFPRKEGMLVPFRKKMGIGLTA